jgi:hypothetical protein
MTDPVNGISGAQGTTAGGSYSGGGFSGGNKKKHVQSTQDDLIEISQDARNRLTGKPKKGLLEYLKNLLG